MASLIDDVRRDFKEFWELPIAQGETPYHKTSYDSVNASLILERLADTSDKDDLALVCPDDPTTGERYGYEAIAAVHTPSPLELGVIQYQWLGRCAADGDFEDTTSAAFAAIRTVLESGETYCIDL